MANQFKVSGFRELSDALGEFKKSTERTVLRRVAIKALQPFVDTAKQFVPVDEGWLRNSIVIGSNLTRNAKSADRLQPKAGVRVFAGTANRNGVPREFGTWRTRPQPFMRPAWDATAPKILDQVQRDLAAEVDKTAARIARKAGKSK